MRLIPPASASALLISLLACSSESDHVDTSSPQAQPNALLIIADDPRYGGPGSYDAEFNTPVLERLAADSGRFSDSCVLPLCPRRRSAQLTGDDKHVDGSYRPTFDHSLHNRRLPKSFVDAGLGWAQAMSAPVPSFRSLTSQGRIKAPLMIRPADEARVPDSYSYLDTHATDVAPTFFDVAVAATRPDST